jgi:hypothetical protein
MRELYLILFSLLCAGAVRAGDVEDADAALLKRDYATALKKYKSAALKSTPYAQYRIGEPRQYKKLLLNMGVSLRLRRV